MSTEPQIRVWDPFVRLSHWVVLAAFVFAQLTDGGLLHEWSGYVIGGLVVLRCAWGVVGPRHARFIDFTYRPRVVADYLRNLAAFKARRYVGHSPAGGAMVLVLLVMLLLTVASGIAALGQEEGAITALHELESELEGDLDLQGFLGLSSEVRPGYQNIRVNFKIKTAEGNLEKLKALSKLSPVFDVTSNGTNVAINIERK